MAGARHLIVLILVLVLRASPIDCDTQALIATVCGPMEDPRFCMNVFNQNLKSPDTDARGLADIALEQGINNASGSAQYAKGLFYQTRDMNLREYLENCTLSGYLPTLGHLRDGQQYLRQSSYGAMVTAILQAPKGQSSCEGQPTISGAPNPMNERNREMRNLILMALAAAFKLQGGTPAAGNN